MEGKRKFTAWIITELLICLIFGVAIGFQVKFQSGDITTIILIVSSLAGAFFGANFGEHWTKAKVKQ